MDNTTLIIVGVIVLIALTGGITFILYRAGFKPKDFTINTGIVTAKVEREAKPAQPQPPARTEVEQVVEDGGQSKHSGIKATASGGAKITQKATGKGSKIDNSPIELT